MRQFHFSHSNIHRQTPRHRYKLPLVMASAPSLPLNFVTPAYSGSIFTKTHIDSPSSNLFMSSTPRSPPKEVPTEDTGSLQEWKGRGVVSPIPTMVQEIFEDLKGLETNFDTQMSFGGLGGKLQGDLKVK